MKKIIYILLILLPAFINAQFIKSPDQYTRYQDLNSVDVSTLGATTTSSDNHAAFRLAILAAVSLNRSIYVPRGVWVTDSLLIPNNITIYGDGDLSVLKFKSGATNGKDFLTIGTNFYIHDLKIDGNSSNLAANVSSSGIYSYHKSYLRIENVTIVNTSQHAFYCDSSDNIIVRNYIVDSVGQAAVRTYNCSNILLEDVDIRGWGVNSTLAAAITTYTHNLNGVRNVFLNRVKTYNKFRNVNFSYESGGISYQMKNIKITYCDFYSPTKGGVGISIGADTLTIFKNRIRSDSSYYGIECSGSAQTITDNDLVNAGVRLGTFLDMTSSNVAFKNNNILWTDSSTGLDHIIGVGGATNGSLSPTTNATYQYYDISDNTLDLRIGKPGAAMVLGYYAGSRGLVKNFTVKNNKVFSRDYVPIVYLSGTNGSSNEIIGNKGYGKNDLALRDNGTYTNTIFANNVIPGGNMQPGTITSTYFPNALFYNNSTDSTRLSEISLNGITNIVGTGSPEGVVGGTVGSTYSRTNGGTGTSFYIKESGIGNTGWVAVSSITQLTANNGLNINAGAVGLGGTLTKNDTISGNTGSYGLSLGTASDALNVVQIYSSALTLSAPGGIKLKTQLAFNAIATATDANYAGASNSAVILPVITANRTIDMTGYAVTGGVIVLMNKNTAAFTWSPINGTLKDPLGNTISSLVNNTNYIFIYDGTNFVEVGVSTLNGLTSSYVAKTTTYTATAADYTIDCTTGTFTVTLPTAIGIPGREYIIKNTGTGTITLATTSSQTIDGVTTKTLNVQYGGLRVQSNGANYIIVASF